MTGYWDPDAVQVEPSSTVGGVASDDDEILGPKCPECGWRGGKHRPKIGEYLEACPRWTPPEPEEN